MANVDYGTTLFVKIRKQDDNGMLSSSGMYKMVFFWQFERFWWLQKEMVGLILLTDSRVVWMMWEIKYANWGLLSILEDI